MEASIFRFTLDVHKTQSQVSIQASQYSTDRRLHIRLMERGIPYEIKDGCFAVFSAIKPDGKPLYNDCAIRNNTIIYDFTRQTTAVVGIVPCQIHLYGSDGRLLMAPRFQIVVHEAIYDGYAEESSAEYTALSNFINHFLENYEWRGEKVFVRYSQNENGEDFTETWTGGQCYIGFAKGLEAPESPLAYTWSLFVNERAFDSAVSRAENAATSAEGHAQAAKDAAQTANTHLATTVNAATAAVNAAIRAEAGATSAANEAVVAEEFALEAKEHADRAEAAIAQPDDLGLEQDEITGIVYPTLHGTRSKNGIPLAASGGGGGGGGGTGNAAIFRMTNTSGWLTKKIAFGNELRITVSWTSYLQGMPTGDGSLSVTVNGSKKLTKGVKQGDVSVDVGKYLVAGANTVAVSISDAYGNSTPIQYTIEAVSVSISSYFDDKQARTGAINYAYTPVGAITKTVHFIVDGTEIGTHTVEASGREQSFTIPAQAHGSHTLEVYFTGEVEGETVESNHLYYDLICYAEGETAPIIATPFRTESVTEYATVSIPYSVYTPGALTSPVVIKEGETELANLTVDRTRQTYAYKARTVGEITLTIESGDTVKPITFTVTESDVDVEAETSGLELYLASEGRSNNEQNPLTWGYGDIQASMTGFNLKSDGWQSDENGDTVLRVTGDARVEIPFEIFKTDFRGTGKTIELELATRDVRNYDAEIITCWSGGRGIKVTAQKALLKSEQSEIFTQYKEDEHIRVTFSVEKRAENRLLSIYINGIMSGVVQYADDDDFSQAAPVGISIGSSECTTDVYCIRVYSNNLTRYQILDNWIADTQNVDDMVERYNRNKVFDAYGNIVPDKLQRITPYLVIDGVMGADGTYKTAVTYDDLPQFKGDKKIVKGWYVDPLHPERSFHFEGAVMDVQGTSSQYYSRKNYKIEFEGGFILTDGVTVLVYQLRPTSMPTNTFTFKADQASSEGANNVELAMLYDATCPVKTPPQLTDSRVRQGIEGYPCVMFYFDGTNYHFIGKYNFNNDKGTEEVFGFEPGDESWEILQNNTEMVIWKDDNFEGDAWKLSFEGRYPDKSTDTARLQAFATWLKSTDTTAAGLTEAQKAERVAKFKAEFETWCNKDAMLFNYIFTEMFLMVDNRAKNAFPTRYDEDGKWLILPYDYDTAIGINNEGELKFGYELEDTDTINGNNVFNGQDSVLYVNMRLAFADEIMKMYQDLRTNDLFSYEEIERRFEEHQKVWGEAVFNEDARFKYIEPLIKEGNKTYLPMAQGAKAEQRKWWLYNRFRYMDSKYNAGDALKDYIMLRSYAVADITVTPYADIYASAKFDSALVQKRALRGSSYTLENPLTGGRDAVISIYSASQLSSVGDLSGLKAGMADFSAATKLSSLKLGDGAADYENPNLTELTIGNLTLLKDIDVRNCTALATSVDLSGCTNIERAYFEGTAITGVSLPDGGVLKSLHLPATITSLDIRNQRQLRDLVIPSYDNVSTLRIEGMDGVLDTKAMLRALKTTSPRVRLIGIDWTAANVQEIYTLFEKLDTCRGLTESGGNADKAVVSGKITVDVISQIDLEDFNERYPDVEIVYNTIGNRVVFVVDGKVLSIQNAVAGDPIIKPSDPVKPSTAQYSYTFLGWADDNGELTEVPAVMGESTEFYALFEQTVREYTVTFVNYDGTTLQAVRVPYGSDAEYTGAEPTQPDPDETNSYKFIGWDPSPMGITGHTTCVAQYTLGKKFDAYTWDEIAAISAEGSARSYFSIGDTKYIDVKGKVGTVDIDQKLGVYIIGIDHNAEIEGGGITFGTFMTEGGVSVGLYDPTYSADDGKMAFNISHWGKANYGGWAGCDLRYDILGSTDVPPSGYGQIPVSGREGYDPSPDCKQSDRNTLMAALPEQLRAVMQPMTKYTNNVGGTGDTEEKVTASIDYLPLLSEFELFGLASVANSYEQNKQKQYEYYIGGKSTIKYKHSLNSSNESCWTRSPYKGDTQQFCYTLSNKKQSRAWYPNFVYLLAPIFKV